MREIVKWLSQEFSANVDAESERFQYLSSPFIARFVRFHPVDWHRRVTMRAGLIGCPHTGTPISAVCS